MTLYEIYYFSSFRLMMLLQILAVIQVGHGGGELHGQVNNAVAGSAGTKVFIDLTEE